MRYSIYILAILIIMFQFFIYKACAIDLEPPEVPPRPTISELKESINSTDKGSEYSIKIRGLKENKKRFLLVSSIKDKLLNRKYDNYQEKTFNINISKLFSSSLGAVQILELTLEYIDAISYEIIVKDNLKNVFFLQLFNKGDKSTIKMYGYAIDATKTNFLLNTMDMILANIRES